MYPARSAAVEIGLRNVLSVHVPTITPVQTTAKESALPYGLAETSADLDDAIATMAELLPKLLRLAEIEKACDLLADEIEKTRRRVNALEYVMIPQFDEAIRAITMIAVTAVIFAAAVMAEPVRTMDAICIVVDGDGPHVLDERSEERTYDDLLLRRSLGDKSMQLLLEPGRTVTITHGDDTHTLTTEAERLSSLLRRSGIRLGEDEMVELNVAGEDPAIRISDTLTYQHYVTVETDYKILRSPDPLMDKGTEEIIRKGIPGQIVETYEDTVVSGEVVSTKYIGASHDTSHAELVRYGTRVYEVEEGDTIEKDFPNEVGEGGYLLFASGDTMTYNKVMLCSSTAYYSGGDGGAAWTTAVGAAVGVGTVAVDPKVIPYYTKMFIQTTNGRRVYGMGTALDCGGAVKGNIVDLWFPTKADCYSWGRRNVTVYILDKKAS